MAQSCVPILHLCAQYWVTTLLISVVHLFPGQNLLTIKMLINSPWIPFPFPQLLCSQQLPLPLVPANQEELRWEARPFPSALCCGQSCIASTVKNYEGLLCRTIPPKPQIGQHLSFHFSSCHTTKLSNIPPSIHCHLVTVTLHLRHGSITYFPHYLNSQLIPWCWTELTICLCIPSIFRVMAVWTRTHRKQNAQHLVNTTKPRMELYTPAWRVRGWQTTHCAQLLINIFMAFLFSSV